MSSVNFVDEFDLFMRFARDNNLSLRERALWMALFYIANDRAVYDVRTKTYDWSDDFICVSNGELNLYSTLDKRGIDDARNALKQRGLIDFTKGERNKRNPAYRLLYLSVNVGYKSVPNNVPNNVPNHNPNNVPNHNPNNVPNHDTNPVPNDAPFNINKIKYIDEDEEEIIRELACVRENFQFEVQGRGSEIVRSYRTHFGITPTPAFIKRLSEYVCMNHISDSLLDYAIQTAAQANPVKPIEYIVSLLRDWLDNGCNTADEADYYVNFGRHL